MQPRSAGGASTSPRGSAEVVLVGGAAVVVVGTFLPWMRSGEVWRSSYALWRSAERLGVVDGGGATVLRVIWLLLPSAAAGALLFVVTGRVRLAKLLCVPLAVAPAVGALVVWRSPFAAGAGVAVTLTGSAVVLAASLWPLRPRLRVADARAGRKTS